MHQTISGETLNIKILNRKHIDEFLKESKDQLNKIQKEKSKCLYDKNKIINDSSLNYLNIDSNQEYIKDIIRKEYDVCESIYPFLGDILINVFFDKLKNQKNKKFFLFNKKEQMKFIKTLKHQSVISIANYIFENASLDYNIFINKYKGNDIIVEKKENIQFNFDFDYDYFKRKGKIKLKNYNFILIEGMIDTMGEIHHLLYHASINKEPYVVFCLGVNQEVKNNIILNNEKGITKVYIIDITSSEKTLNILNDIALVHKSGIVSAFKGETISQEIKKGIKVGKEISIDSNKISIKPLCSKVDLNVHKQFLIRRINESSNDENKKILEERYKNVSNKSIEIFLPDFVLADNSFQREIDYLFRFFSNVKLPMQKIFLDEKFYYIPKCFVEIVEKKSKNLKKMFNNIEKLIVFNH